MSDQFPPDSHTGTQNFVADTITTVLSRETRDVGEVVEILLGKGFTPQQVVDLLTVDD